MLKGKIIDQIVKNSNMIRIDPSRCSRMRYNKNSCERCLKACDTGAISIESSVAIHRDTCSECMLCVSECRSGALEIYGLNFNSLAARLKRIPSPVLSCEIKPDMPAHERTSCLGFLSEEHLIALLVFLPGKLQINVTECVNCRNGLIVSVLKKRLERVEVKTSMKTFQKIRLVEKKAELDYQDISYDRRGFFKALKSFGVQKTASLFKDEHSNKSPGAYSSKILSAKRDLLNRVISAVSGEVYQRILRNYYYNVTVDGSCNNCFACVAMCPTGALKSRGDQSDTGLLFNTFLCSGCGLCASFCRSDSIFMEQGSSGHDPFKFGDPKKGGFQCNHGGQSSFLSVTHLSRSQGMG